MSLLTALWAKAWRLYGELRGGSLSVKKMLSCPLPPRSGTQKLVEVLKKRGCTLRRVLLQGVELHRPSGGRENHSSKAGIRLGWPGHVQSLEIQQEWCWAPSFIWKVVLREVQCSPVSGWLNEWARKSWRGGVRLLAWMSGDVTSLQGIKKKEADLRWPSFGPVVFAVDAWEEWRWKKCSGKIPAKDWISREAETGGTE